jgi:hypothetical protein
MVNAYEKFQRTTTVPWQFPFAVNLICDIEERGGNYYAAVTNSPQIRFIISLYVFQIQ